MDTGAVNDYYRITMPPSRRNPSSHSSTGRSGTQIRDLVLSAADGSTRAFHQLADRYQNDVFRVVYHRVRSQMDAEDLTQEIFLTAYRHLPRLKRPERFRSWLFSIALNRIRDHLRRNRWKRLLGLGSDNAGEADPDRIDGAESGGMSPWERRDFWNIVAVIGKRMSAGEREVFTLRFIDQLSIVEIAQVLHKGESTVKTQLYRAIAKFRAHPEAIHLKGLMS